jgi:hypothetical protein
MTSLEELKSWVRLDSRTVTPETLDRGCQELDYNLDVRRAARGVHTELLLLHALGFRPLQHIELMILKQDSDSQSRINTLELINITVFV